MGGASLEVVGVLRGAVGDDVLDSIEDKGQAECNTTG